MRTSFSGLLLLCGITFSASVLADSQPPSTVNGVSAVPISSSSIRVNWNKPFDDNGVKGYNIYRDGSYIATAFDTNFVDTGLGADRGYSYGIVAFDNAQNFNSVSNAVTGTTYSNDPNSRNTANNNAAPPPPETDSNNGGGAGRPTGVHAEIINGNTATIRWNASSGNIRGYNVFKDGGYAGTVIGKTDYTSEGMQFGRDHEFFVQAFDHSNNFSEKSAVVIVNTNNGAAPAQNSQAQNDGGSNNNNNNSGSVPAGYNLVFSDEFNGYSLDTSKWNSSYRWGAGWVINGEKQYYVDRINNPDFGHSPFEFDGNNMTISAIRTPEHLRASANWQPYLSGALTTYNKFKMKYGYIEIRAQLPKGQGLWSAFWLLHQNDNDRRPEIDVVEYIGNRPNTVYNTYHYYENFSLRSSPSYEVGGTDYSQDFHTYGVKWEPGKLTWYVDGQERNYHNDGNVAWEDMYLLVNLAVGGWWPGDPDGNTRFPAQMKIDYIRAYQQ